MLVSCSLCKPCCHTGRLGGLLLRSATRKIAPRSQNSGLRFVCIASLPLKHLLSSHLVKFFRHIIRMNRAGRSRLIPLRIILPYFIILEYFFSRLVSSDLFNYKG